MRDEDHQEHDQELVDVLRWEFIAELQVVLRQRLDGDEQLIEAILDAMVEPPKAA
jgi:hypothetical protein